MNRRALEEAWLRLTREEMPAAAKDRSWPVHLDHCFQRILLDNAAGRVWYEAVEKRPAYRHASEELLGDALALGRRAMAGEADLDALNANSLRLRGKSRR